VVRRRWVDSILLPGLVLAVAAIVVTMWGGLQRRLMYFPFGNVPPPEQVGLPRAEQVSIKTEDGLSLGAWFVPAASPGNGTTILIFNGNGGNRAMRAPLAAALADRHIASLLLDYRGYGGNLGAPSEGGLARDARAALRYVTTRSDVDPERIVYFGESLGSGVAVRLATERPPRVLILRSPYTSIVDVARHHYPIVPVGWLLRDRFPSVDRIKQVRSPVLIIAGRRDGVVPSALSEGLYEAANEPKELLMFDGVDHNDYELLAGRRMIDAIVRFLGGRD
jgi:fermentation-respiration switch protein FrsA (DUF1100 family)